MVYLSCGNGVPKRARLVAKEGGRGRDRGRQRGVRVRPQLPEKLWKKLHYRTPTSA